MRRLVLFVAVFLVFGCAAACGHSAPQPEAPILPGEKTPPEDPSHTHTASTGRAVSKGEDAPDLSLEDSTGRSHTIGELHASGPAIVVFYHGAWCQVCRDQLSRFQDKLAAFPPNTRIAAISRDPKLTSTKLADGLKLGFPLLSDPDLRAAKAFGVADVVSGLAMPAIFVVSKSGKVAWVHVGEDSFVEDQALDAAREVN